MQNALHLMYKYNERNSDINHFFAFSGETPGPFDSDPGNQGGWVSILPWLMLAVFYFLTAGSDPTPETTWSTFYREMLSTGEVYNNLLSFIACRFLGIDITTGRRNRPGFWRKRVKSCIHCSPNLWYTVTLVFCGQTCFYSAHRY